MIVHVASFLESIGGSIDKEHYLRPIPGRTGWAAYCKKPEYSKKKQKEMAERPIVKSFAAVSAEWEAKYRAALREASKHQRMPDEKGKPYVPGRLCDFVRKELAKQVKEG